MANNNNFIINLLKFQINRKIIGLAKKVLIILEENKNRTLEMHQLLKDIGIECPCNAEEKYQKERKNIFNEAGEAERELCALIDTIIK